MENIEEKIIEEFDKKFPKYDDYDWQGQKIKVKDFIREIILKIQKQEREKIYNMCADLHKSLYDLRNNIGKDFNGLDDQMLGIRMVKSKIDIK